MSLQQLELAKQSRSAGFIVGASNDLLRRQTDWVDVVIDVTTGEILYNTDGLSDLLSLTTADMRFVECLTHTVGDENSDDTQWEGSNDWIRAQFSFYLLSMLSCSLSLDEDTWVDFNEGYVAEVRCKRFYRIWKETPNAEIADVEPRHPFYGQYTTADLRRQLLELTRRWSLKLTPQQRDRSTKAVAAISSRVGSWWSSASRSVQSWMQGRRTQESDEEQDDNY
ncbi:late secretory pathway protein AVL9 homolog [Corticium candelabrum]|uniref:late secretory pathway protein AVL9 homolog n=1 Tax=Corticium candelabrum TaxID=121492 RepID=UPI002E26EBC3|nr:late secretory pathway protein AVL9 homolog [Corticium candelabrum]